MLSRYESACNNKGGIKSIKLIDAREFLGCDYDKQSRCFSNIKLSEGAEFCNISYYENSAYYSESTKLDKGHTRVSHSLNFSLCDTDEPTQSLVDKILDGSIRKLIALVTDNNSNTYLVGYSSQFLSERPLKLSLSSNDTAYSLSSRPMNTISLSSEDVSKALHYL